MRILATSLLGLMAVVFVLAKTWEGEVAFLAWVRAFSEAAMVGALADWFAVTALFRHPLGLPIPHTAIIAREKGRIGAVLARFMRGSFLTKEVMLTQWQEREPLRQGLSWLADDKNEREIAKALRGVWTPVRAGLQGGESTGKIGHLLRESFSQLPMDRCMAVLLRGFLASESRRAVMAPLLGRLADAVEGNRDFVMTEASHDAPLQNNKVLGALTSAVTRVFSGKAVEKVGAKLREASQDETHQFFDKIEEALGKILTELEQGGAAIREWSAFKDRLIEDPETTILINRALKGAGNLIEREWIEGENSRGGEMVAEVACSWLEREDFGDLNEKLGRWLAGQVERHGGHLEAWVTRIVESWEADELIERMESHVGADMQFIRINGTLIGGCVGVILHALSGVIWG